MSDSTFERLWRRVASMAGVARIAATAGLGGQGVQRAQVRYDAEESRDDTALMAHYGFTSRPQAGADAVVISLAGNRSASLIIATNDRRYQLDLAAGEVALHSDEGDSVHLMRGRVVRITAGTRLELDAPLVTCSGRLEAAGDVTADGISLQHHLHGGVQAGSSQTQEPIA